MASRAVDSQQMLVAQPVMITVSMPFACSRPCMSDDPSTNVPKRNLLMLMSPGSTWMSGWSAWPGWPTMNVENMPARLSGVQNESNQFDQLFLLSSLIELWMKTLSAPASRQAALMRLMFGMTDVAGAISAGAPGVMKPTCMSMMR